MITTKKGDQGQTDCGGMRVDKSSLVVEVLGEIDELQAVLELIKGQEDIVDDLYQLMGIVGCGSEVNVVNKVFRLEKEIEKQEKTLPELKKFLRFEKEKSLKLNWARTIARRLERNVVRLDRQEKLDGKILEYFNRLSDYLFLMARRAEEE